MTQTTKTVAITGGASGLGKALALRFARAGWKVAIADVNQERGDAVLAELKTLTSDAFYQQCDVRNASDVLQWRDTILSHWQRIDVVINNAGVATYGSIDRCSLEDWDWVVDINLMGVVRGCKYFSEAMKQQGFGHIVNVASMAGLVHSPEMSSYNATKAGVVALSETLRGELHPFGIGITLVCPGFFRTNLAESTRSPDADAKNLVNKLLARSVIDADDIANMIFLAIEQKKYLVLPHSDYRRLWYMKRFMPFLYTRLMGKIGSKIAHIRKTRTTLTSEGTAT
ncbi:MAG TPA: SDR family oxidoreductase [Dongiaceae bacterium]|nr:SDR family oxidoreductase [Dongiaceae bacterium]